MVAERSTFSKKAHTKAWTYALCVYTSPFVERLTWARPIIQLWHMKWDVQKMIVKLHWVESSQKFTYGLRFDALHIERQKYNPTKCDFHQTHHLLRDTYEGLVLDALR